MASPLLYINYYYPNGERLNDRLGCVTIERDALVVHLVEKIRRDIDIHIKLDIFKVSFEWDDINPGTAEEPNRLGLVNLLRILNGDNEPLENGIALQRALPLPVITGPRRFTYCAILAIPSSQVKLAFGRPGSSQSLELEKLFLNLEVESEDCEQLILPILHAIDSYDISIIPSIVPTWTSPYNGRRFPSLQSSANPDLLLHNILTDSSIVTGPDDSGLLNSEFWGAFEQSGANFSVLLGAPQSGKTTALLRFLRNRFGLYLVAKDPQTGSSAAQKQLGSTDLYSIYINVSSRATPSPHVQNDRLVSSEILKIVLSRLVFLHKMLCDDSKFSPTQWLLLQAFPNDFSTPKRSTFKFDIFHAIATSIPSGNRDMLRRLIHQFRGMISHKIGEYPQEPQNNDPLLPIILDEAHYFLPIDRSQWVFTAWGRAEHPNMPFYTVVMDTLADDRICGKVVVAGTGLRLNSPPAIGRNSYTGGVVLTINSQLHPEDVSAYLLSLDIHIDKKLGYWLKGRPGFAAAFARACLQLPALEEYPEAAWSLDENGELNPTRKKRPWDLEEFFFETFLPHMSESTDGSNALWPRFERLHLSSERIANEVWTRFKKAIFLQTYQSGYYEYEHPRDIQLFESGVAFIHTRRLLTGNRLVTQLSEPMLVWAACQYIRAEAPDEFARYLRSRLADAPGPSGQGKIWEQTIPNAVAALFGNAENQRNIVWQRVGYRHEEHTVIMPYDVYNHQNFGLDVEFADTTFVDWLEDTKIAVYCFPENEAGPDAATVTRDGVLVLVQCKLTKPPSALNSASKPSAFSAFSSVLPNTFYRPRKDAKKITGQSVAIRKMELNQRARYAIQNKFKCVVGVILAYGGFSWPRGCTTPEQRFTFIKDVKVRYEAVNPNGTAAPAIHLSWTEGVDALYVFEGSEQLEKLYDDEHLHFLSTLKGTAEVESVLIS